MKLNDPVRSSEIEAPVMPFHISCVEPFWEAQSSVGVLVGLFVGGAVGPNVGAEVGTFVGQSVGIRTAELQKAPAPPGLITRENAVGTTSRDHLFAHSQAMAKWSLPHSSFMRAWRCWEETKKKGGTM